MAENKKNEGIEIEKPPKQQLPMPTHYCAGCQYGSITRIICEALEELQLANKAVVITGVGCNYIGALYFKLDAIDSLHGRAPNVGTGIKRARFGDAVVITMQGDGDTAAIGMGELINAIHRGEKLTTIMVNNANYGMTGGQMAPTTLVGQMTSTTVDGRDLKRDGTPMHVAELISTFEPVAYSARVAVNTVANFNRARRAIKKAIEVQVRGIGYGFVEALSACPPGWRMSPQESLKWIGKEMINEYPLGEFKNILDKEEKN